VSETSEIVHRKLELLRQLGIVPFDIPAEREKQSPHGLTEVDLQTAERRGVEQ
jgi:hypothetical protein